MTVRHVVNFSGGAGSFAAAHRVVERHGPDNVTLLTADTMSEADDWLDFVRGSAQCLGVELVLLRDGRDIWELAADQGAIPSSRIGFCSRILKHQQIDRWQAANCDPADTVIHLGFDWTEQHRLHRARHRMHPWQVDAPLCWDPPISKQDCLELVERMGLPTPMAYRLGLPHNNCLKYGCVKGGQAYWKRLHRDLPEVFARAEAAEETLREQVGDHAMLRDRTGGTPKPLPLTELRRRIEVQPSLLDGTDWGSCSCFSDD